MTGPVMREIACEVAQRYGLSLGELRSDNRRPKIVNPRQEAMALMLDAGRTTTQIGRFFDRDHTTVIHGVRRHLDRVKQGNKEWQA